jgi:hypothetical protein
MSYRVLGLDPYSQHMSLPVLRAIHKLVEDGAVVAGPKPTTIPAWPTIRRSSSKLNDELFGDGTGVHKVGKGTVYAGQSLEGCLQAALQVAPDFDYTKPESDARLLFVHRKLADGDLYFVDNRNDRDEDVDATFRVTGKAPELWHAETGKSEPVSFKIADGRTTVPLQAGAVGHGVRGLPQGDQGNFAHLAQGDRDGGCTVDGPWKVSFQPDRGAPASDHAGQADRPGATARTAGVKYFSGAGTYTKTINAKAEWFKKGAQVWIDLGDVKNLAEVTVNGKPLGVVWHTPYRVDATGALKPGANEVSIKVINAWVNRLIGDEQPGATKYTFADVKPYKATRRCCRQGCWGRCGSIR